MINVPVENRIEPDSNRLKVLATRFFGYKGIGLIKGV